MQTTMEQRAPRRWPRRSMLVGSGLVAVVVLANAFIAKARPADASTLWLMTGIGLAGLVAIAWLCARSNIAPRWGWMGAAAVLGLGLVIGTALTEPSRAGIKDLRQLVWLFDWMLVMFAFTPATSRSYACAGSERRLGWIMIGSAVLLSLIMLILPRMLDALHIGMVL